MIDSRFLNLAFLDEIKTKLGNLTYDNAWAHNSVYRGKNLGSAFTDEQSAAIRAGTFKDIYVGDSWQFTNVPYSWYRLTADTTAQEGKTYYADATGTESEAQPEVGADITEAGYFEKVDTTYSGTMRAADCDYLSMSNAHHVTVVPDEPLFNARMNPTNTTKGGYVLSEMRTVHLKRAEAIFKACFGENHIMSYKDMLVDGVVNGIGTSGIQVDCSVELMDERMLLGAPNLDSSTPNGSGQFDAWLHPSRYSRMSRQLSLFSYLHNPTNTWFRNITNSGCFACFFSHGCYPRNADINSAVRPFAFIY